MLERVYLARRVPLDSGLACYLLVPLAPASPANHPIFRLLKAGSCWFFIWIVDELRLKAGEAVCQTLLVPKITFFTLNTFFQRVYQTFLSQKQRLRHVLPGLKCETGYGTRHRSADSSGGGSGLACRAENASYTSTDHACQFCESEILLSV